MADKPLNERTVKEIVDSFLATDDLKASDKIHLFVQLVDEKKLLEQMQHHDLCVRVGMSLPDPIYDFAYGVLRLAKPHLFADTKRVAKG